MDMLCRNRGVSMALRSCTASGIRSADLLRTTAPKAVCGGSSVWGWGRVARQTRKTPMWVLIVYCAVIFVLGFPSRAHAYLDPGTGSAMLQGVAAVFLV